jgi:hypothetical protein
MPWLQKLPAIQTLSEVWRQQYRGAQGQVSRLTPKEMPPVGEWIRSPYDREVRSGKKRSFEWIGYKVHLSEYCDDDLPHLITQVETVPAIEQDHHALVPIQADLAAKGLLPEQQLVDAGYISAKRILHSRENHGIDLMGPVQVDPSWQARTPGALDPRAIPHRLATATSHLSARTAEQCLVSEPRREGRVYRPHLLSQTDLSSVLCTGKMHRCTEDGTKYDAALPSSAS